MKKGGMVLLGVLGVVGLLFLALSGTYNGLVKSEETVKQAWSQVENVYQRRLDLIPNLVETVKGYAAHEQDTFTRVTEARSKAAGSLDPSALTDPAKFEQFQQSQGALSSALGRLMVIVERYPELKANQNFLQLQAQLEGTENRISVERGRFNEAAQGFNVRLRTFPTNILGGFLGFKLKEYFKSDPQASAAPKIQF